MRVLVVTHAYPRWDGDVAGAFIERLCIALAARGHAIEVLAPSDQGKGGNERRHGVDVVRLRYGSPDEEVLAYRGTMADAARSLAGFRTFAGLVSAFRRAIVERGRGGAVDVVHAHWWLPGGIAAWRARRASGLPYVVTLHGTDVALLRRSAIARAAGRRVLGSAARVNAVSSFLASEASAACGLDQADIVVQPMPVSFDEPDRIVDRPDRLDRPDRRGAGGGAALRLITVGRLTPQKRHELLLEAVRRLADAEVSVAATLVGDGPEREHLEALARRLGIHDAVRFMGAVPPAEVRGYLAQSDVFVFPAEREGFGLAAVEALMQGVPVVACTDGGGAREIVSDGEGRIVPPDAAALAEAAQTIAQDPDARERARAAGAEWRRRLAPERAAAVFEQLYEEVRAGRS